MRTSAVWYFNATKQLHLPSLAVICVNTTSDDNNFCHLHFFMCNYETPLTHVGIINLRNFHFVGLREWELYGISQLLANHTQ